MNMKKIIHAMNQQKWSQIIRNAEAAWNPAVKWCADNDINIKTFYYLLYVLH